MGSINYFRKPKLVLDCSVRVAFANIRGSLGVRRKCFNLFSLSLTNRVSLTFILIFASVVVLDSTIPRFLTHSGLELSTSSNVGIFITFSTIYAISGIILLSSVMKDSSKYSSKLPLNLKYFHGIILTTQLANIGIIMTILLQMAISHKYSIYLLHGSVFLTHISALVFMAFLVYIFTGWLKSKKNYMIILYTLSFTLISATILVSLLYLESSFSIVVHKDIRPYPINFVIIQLPVTPWTEVLSSSFDILSLVSFLAVWLATITLLYQYRYKVGRIRYFALTSIPLIYYLVPFQDYFGNLFSPFALSSPITFAVAYVITFSATKQIGALLFSLAFWTTSILVANDGVRKSLLISAIGMSTLFGSIHIATLPYKIYPPYGLVTEAFMPLGAYLLFTGIFTSATSVSKSADLRKEFYKTAKSQLTLLKTIGVTQMEKELEKRYKSLHMHTRKLEANAESYPEEDAKQILRDVLNELYSKSKDQNK